MAGHHGPDGPDQAVAAPVGDGAQTPLSAYDAAREQATPRPSRPQLGALLWSSMRRVSIRVVWRAGST